MKTSQKIYLPFKRLIGIFGSFVGIIVCFALLWWWVIPVNAIVTKGHPFFARHRIGKDGKAFRCLKFRSMRADVDPHMSSLDDGFDKGITGFGKFLRVTSIDETLQLFNIFIGQMAFIGPRPGSAHNEEELVVEREKYTPNAFEVKPGLGGLAQYEMHRDHIPENKAYYDHIYAEKISLWFDIKLFFQTIFSVFKSSRGK